MLSQTTQLLGRRSFPLKAPGEAFESTQVEVENDFSHITEPR